MTKRRKNTGTQATFDFQRWFFVFRVQNMWPRMTLRSAASLPMGGLFQSTAILALAAMLNGCISMGLSEQIATREEPKEAKIFFLTADEKSYTVSRWWGADYETVVIKRRDLPAGCETARFFFNDSTREIRIMEPEGAPWSTGEAIPLPDESFSPCSLLVSYGSFSGPPELEGLVVTSSTGLVAKEKRQQPQPAVWALTPAAMMVEGYAMVGALWTMPIWGPIAYINEKNKETRRERYNSDFHQAVIACWAAVDDKVTNGWYYGANIRVTRFDWSPENENAYELTTVDEPCSAEDATPVDTRVTLHKGRLDFRSQEAEADIECGLKSGNVVAVKVKPLQ